MSSRKELVSKMSKSAWAPNRDMESTLGNGLENNSDSMKAAAWV